MKVSGCFTFEVPSYEDSNSVAQGEQDYYAAVKKFIDEKDLGGLIIFVSSEGGAERVAEELNNLTWIECQKA